MRTSAMQKASTTMEGDIKEMPSYRTDRDLLGVKTPTETLASAFPLENAKLQEVLPSDLVNSFTKGEFPLFQF